MSVCAARLDGDRRRLRSRDGASHRAEYLVLLGLVVIFVWRGFLPAWRSLNTDFANNYLAARLYRQGYPVNKLYDWIWTARQKDHAGIARPVVEFIPYTLVSALPILPFSSLPPLDAKRAWLVVTLILLFCAGCLINRMTSLGARRIALLTFLALDPLRANFLYGQSYVLMLVLLVLATWLFLDGRPGASGLTLALGSVIKIYPILFLLYFSSKRQWRAVAGMIVGLLGLGILSVLLFGYEANRTYVVEILPRALRGEIIDPYSVEWNSFTALLRRIFIAEPALNPQPLIVSPTAYAVLQPLCQALLFVPFLWSTSASRFGSERLEWASLVALLLVLSPVIASYHHCVLILAVALAADDLLKFGQRKDAAVLVLLYGFACLPLFRRLARFDSSWKMFLAFPRLYAMVALTGFLLWRLACSAGRPSVLSARSHEAVPFGLLFLAITITGAASTLRHFRGQFTNYSHRLAAKPESLMSIEPSVAGDSIFFTAMAPRGYVTSRLVANVSTRLDFGLDAFHPTLADRAGEVWVELASTRSRVVRFSLERSALGAEPWRVEVEDAGQPAVSRDGKWLAFIREKQGKGSLWVKELGPSESGKLANLSEREVADSDFDVLEAAFLPDHRIVFAAEPDGRPRLFMADAVAPGILPEPIPARARYPAVSPDGLWLAYSQEDRGAWQLWMLKLSTGERHRLTSGDCNSVSPAWRSDSKTLIYATDCGRGLDLTALCELRAVP